MRPDYLSVSQVNAYLQCPRKYLYRYIERRVPERASIDLAFGRAVHTALGWWAEERIAGRSPGTDVLRRTFRADFTGELTTPKLDLEGKSVLEVRGLGERLVELGAKTLELLTPVASETRFEVELIDPATRRALPIPLVGYIDLEFEEDVLGEIKTAGRKTGVSSYLLQLAAYRYGWRRMHNRVPRMQVIELLKTKGPDAVVLEANVSDRDEAWFAEVASHANTSIAKGAFHPVPNYLCGRCEFLAACRSHN